MASQFWDEKRAERYSPARVPGRFAAAEDRRRSGRLGRVGCGYRGTVGAAIFPGDPARVTFDDLNREPVGASLESNHTGPLLLAKTLGQVLTVDGGLTLRATADGR